MSRRQSLLSYGEQQHLCCQLVSLTAGQSSPETAATAAGAPSPFISLDTLVHVWMQRPLLPPTGKFTAVVGGGMEPVTPLTPGGLDVTAVQVWILIAVSKIRKYDLFSVICCKDDINVCGMEQAPAALSCLGKRKRSNICWPLLTSAGALPAHCCSQERVPHLQLTSLCVQALSPN